MKMELTRHNSVMFSQVENFTIKIKRCDLLKIEMKKPRNRNNVEKFIRITKPRLNVILLKIIVCKSKTIYLNKIKR